MGTPRILIVEDDAILAAHLESLLIKFGYQVAGLAATGEAAVKQALYHMPEAILMDIRLRGEMTGIQAAVLIHQQADLPVIYLSAYTDEGLLQEAKITDAYAYLAKPVRDRELRASLEMALYKHRVEKHIAHLNQVLRAIRDVNQLITREQDTQNLLEGACQILVRTRGYRFVWIGQLEGEHTEPLASAGMGQELLDLIMATATSEQAKCLPCASSMRAQEVIVCRDMRADERYAPWRKEIEQAQFRSSAAIPMLHAGTKLGVLCVFAEISDVFDDEEIDLLQEVAGDMGFALKTLEEQVAREQAEQALQASEEKYRGLIESLDNIVILVDADGRFLFLNEVAARPFRDMPQPPVGRLMTEVFPEPYGSAQVQVIQTVIREDRARTADAPRMVQGQLGWYHTTIQPIHDETGRPVQALINAVDITELKNAQQELEEFNRTLEQRVEERAAELSDLYNNAPCGYHSLDADGVFVRINDTELRWLGYTREELIGKLHITNLFTPASVQIFKETFPLFKQRGWLKDIELEFIRKNGSILPVLLNATIVADEQGNFLMSRSTISDNSERKRADKINQNLNESLVRRSDELESSNKELEAFADSVSHDLRAPLRAIDGFSRILQEEYASQLDDEGNRLFNVIRVNARKMDMLITDLLALSRISRAGLNIIRVDMAELARLVFHELATAEVQEQFELTIAPLPDAYGDPTLLRQVWINLLSNAIKYTLPRAEHRIEVGAYPQEGMNVYFVRDSGVGFNQEYAHKLFGVFQRLHRTEDFEGTGVGLAIVRRIVHRHGGITWAEGKINQGATIYFSLPEKGVEREPSLGS